MQIGYLVCNRDWPCGISVDLGAVSEAQSVQTEVSVD